MAKLTASQVLVAGVIIYGSYRVIKHTQERRRAIKSSRAPKGALNPSPFAPPAADPGRVVDWRAAGTNTNILRMIEQVLEEEGAAINSSVELAYAVGARLWPGASIHPAGLQAVQLAVHTHVRWPDQPSTPAYQEACVRMRARAKKVLDRRLGEEIDSAVFPSTQELQTHVASSVFPERQWPPTEGDPAWCHEVWRRCGILTQDVISRLSEETAQEA